MSTDLMLFVLLVIALAVGFALGQRQRRTRRSVPPFSSRDYIESLNHLLNERHDLAIDSFVERMAADSDTVDTHLALGSLVRRRGEVDKATSIHQQLLARTTLSDQQRRQCEFELARDYHAAGLLDRAEDLLVKLSEEAIAERATACRWLLDIYQQETDWARAAQTGRRLVSEDPDVAVEVAHYECELAETQLASAQPEEARATLARAAKMDPQCARVHLLKARIELDGGNATVALQELRRVCELEPALLCETLDLFSESCELLGDNTAYLQALRNGLETSPGAAVVDRYAEHLQTTEGADTAIDFRLRALEAQPDLDSFITLLAQLNQENRHLDSAAIAPLLKFARGLRAQRSAYRCRQCGYGSDSLMWHCPSCRAWGQMKPIVPPANG